jgi:flavodoxin
MYSFIVKATFFSHDNHHHLCAGGKDKTMKKGMIVYSSKTGNTAKVAQEIYERLNLENISELHPVESAPDPASADWLLVGFWVDKGDADPRALEYIGKIMDKKVGVFGTLGAYPGSQHAEDVKERVGARISKNNALLGSFLCQGKIDPKLREMFRGFPPGHPHAMTPERIKRHQDAESHPDNEDITAAADACREMLIKAGVC